MIQYGLISKVDARCLEKTIDLICCEFDDEDIYVTEIGLFNCQTIYGIASYILNKERFYKCTGIDNEKDKPIDDPYWLRYIKGNSNEVYNQLEDNSQHLIFADGDHTLIGAISDFFAYESKVKVGGYFAFHDTGEHIRKFKDFQHGDTSNPDAYISVRKALVKIGLFNANYYGHGMLEEWIGSHGFELIFDEADRNDEAGGICVFKKLY